MRATSAGQLGTPLWTRCTIVGACSAGLIGAVVGLIIGLRVYPPTALFGAVELGLPAAVVGAVAGAATGGVMTVRRRIRRKRELST
jgi:hypothetical protein